MEKCFEAFDMMQSNWLQKQDKDGGAIALSLDLFFMGIENMILNAHYQAFPFCAISKHFIY